MIVTGAPLPCRAARRGASIGARPEAIVDDLTSVIGNTGTAQLGLSRSPTCSTGPSPDRSSCSVKLSDGADVVVLRTTDELAAYREPPGDHRRRADRSRSRRPRLPDLPHVARLPAIASHRGVPIPSVPRRRRRCAPSRGSTASSEPKCTTCGTRHLPPARVCVRCDAVDQMDPERARRHPGHDRDVHDRPAGVLAVAADGRRRDRLRRRWPLPVRADRRRSRPR